MRVIEAPFGLCGLFLLSSCLSFLQSFIFIFFSYFFMFLLVNCPESFGVGQHTNFDNTNNVVPAKKAMQS